MSLLPEGMGTESSAKEIGTVTSPRQRRDAPHGSEEDSSESSIETASNTYVATAWLDAVNRAAKTLADASSQADSDSMPKLIVFSGLFTLIAMPALAVIHSLADVLAGDALDSAVLVTGMIIGAVLILSGGLLTAVQHSSSGKRILEQAKTITSAAEQVTVAERNDVLREEVATARLHQGDSGSDG
jgi:hypothetical protein